METIVIGAGLSGLVAAAALHEAGVRVQVVEADVGIGGRIRAVRDPEGDRPLADLGPTWVWPKYQPAAARWIGRLGLQTFGQYNKGDAVILGHGSAPMRQPLPGQDGMVRIAGGSATLIDALAERVGTARIRTSAPVAAVYEDGRHRVAVHLASGEVVTADRVILSVPLRVAAMTMKLPWAPQAMIDAMRATPTWMSTHAKAVAFYDRPFWREAGLSGRIASRLGPLVEAHDHTGIDGMPAALFGFVGWPPESRRADPDALRRAILDQLSDCFGTEAGRPLDLIIEDWALNPHIVTERDLSRPADHPVVGPRILRQPHLGGRVRIAVSEAAEQSPGLIDGAFAIGEGTARDLLAERV